MSKVCGMTVTSLMHMYTELLVHKIHEFIFLFCAAYTNLWDDDFYWTSAQETTLQRIEQYFAVEQ